MDLDLDKQLLQLEEKFWRAMKDKDIDAAVRLSDDPCIITGAQGVARIDRQTFAQMMRGANWTLHDFDIRDVQVQKLSDDVAVIGSRVRETLTVEGKPVEIEAADASTWIKKNGEWVCALHTESLLGDPFGRDRARSGR